MQGEGTFESYDSGTDSVRARARQVFAIANSGPPPEDVENQRDGVDLSGEPAERRRVDGRETAMKYLILIHQNRGAREQFAAMSEEVQAAGLAAYAALNGGAGRGPASSSPPRRWPTTAPAPSSGSSTPGFVTTDGPFAEAKEMLAGIYLVDVAGLRERAVRDRHARSRRCRGARPPSRSGR